MTDQNSISFQANGAPYSTHFNDIYFDTKSGCQQSELVFIKSNNIYQRLLTEKNSFTIAETGFGTGLNFLLTLQTYHQVITELKNSEENAYLPALSFISVEKYPLSKAQLIQSLAIWPELAYYANLLTSQYPGKPEKKCLLNFFDGQVKLQLIFDDAADALTKLKAPKTGIIDAWFLDGFSPAKNPDMWSESLFEQIARLSKEQATLGTFTVAGFVRRQLYAIGFRVEKRAIDCDKKEMLYAKYQHNKKSGNGYQLRPLITKPQHVSIIGGGIASACAAYALTKQGIKVTLYCKDNKVAQGASSNAIGALFPLIHQQRDDISAFYEHAFWHAKSLYQSLLDQGFHFSHDWCGLLEVSYKETLQKRQKAFEQLAQWPKALIHSIDNDGASKAANLKLNYGGLFMPNAGWIAPQELVEQLFKAASLTNRLRIENNVAITHLEQKADKSWRLHSVRETFKATVVVVCGGADSIKLNIINQLPLTSVRGQVTRMSSNKTINKLSTVICHKGYLTPAHRDQHCIGATFDKNSFNIESSIEDDRFNLAMLEKCLPNLTDWQEQDIAGSKARLRCSTPDHLPMVGIMPDIAAHKPTYAHLAKDKNWRFYQSPPSIDNLYVITGLGARGLCSAPLLADILTAELSGTPYPVDNKMLFNLSPNRFVIRDIIKRKFDS
ncbi:bifunctional tRNA (5-methylaminomethyl-2-thiouridine)(34)-methyltransferase MnmD/FAD-dependent 5-carboxymethylaminomethyl-2-thiouridine(34) oxidoreductase MnmC [Colwelliaceae bacterium 6471]